MHLSVAPLTRTSDTLKTEKQFCKNFSNFIDSLEQPTSQNLKKLNFYQNSPNKKKSLDLGFEFFPVLCVECCTVVQTCTLYTFKPYVVFGKQHNRFYSRPAWAQNQNMMRIINYVFEFWRCYRATFNACQKNSKRLQKGG